MAVYCFEDILMYVRIIIIKQSSYFIGDELPGTSSVVAEEGDNVLWERDVPSRALSRLYR